MMHGFQQIITEAECRYNFVVHGLPPRGDEMAVSPLSWRKKLMDSTSGNLGYAMIAHRESPPAAGSSAAGTRPTSVMSTLVAGHYSLRNHGGRLTTACVVDARLMPTNRPRGEVSWSS